MQNEITLRSLQPYLSFIGTFVQLGAILLLIALFALLHPYTRRRRYFRTWLNAWVALAVALLALVLRYQLLPTILDPQILGSTSTRLAYFAYQAGKLGFYGLLVTGTLRYVKAAPSYTSIVAGASFLFLYSALSVWQSANLSGVVLWQAPPAVAGLAFSAWLMLRLPASRRSIGSTIMGGFFSFAAALWTSYFIAFNSAWGASPAARVVATYNTYLDMAWHVALGFGMVVLLLEDMKHESDAAHAELRVAHDNLRRASLYDPVTGSLNRQAFADGLGLEAAIAGFGAVLMLDMDDLKQVNDENGHAAGDAALRYLVDVLRASLRPSDKLYRWGGDEFLIVFPNAHTARVTNRIRRLLDHTPPLKLTDDVQVALRVSVGAATFSGGEDLAEAIDKADRAMYADKMNRKKAMAHEEPQNA